MNSEADFLAAIGVSPGDELLLGAFADWLEEQGDRRAQWVRLSPVRAWMGPTFADPVEPILESLRQRRKVTDCRRAAAEIGEAIVPGLVELLKHDDEYVRLQAAFCLRRIGKRAAAAVPALMEALKDEEPNVREQAAKALKDIGLKKGADTSVLREALSDNNYMVRQKAASLLASLGAKGETVEQLAAQLNDEEVAVRYDAVVALGNLKNKDAIAPLCRALSDEEMMIREEAGLFLREQVMRDMTDAIEPLRAALTDESERVRRYASQALGRLRESAQVAIPDLLKLLKDKAEHVRQYAAEALGAIGSGDAKVLRALYRATTDRETAVAIAAAKAMGKWETLPAEAGDIVLCLHERIGDTYGSAEVLEVFGRLEALTPPVLALLRQTVRAVARGDDRWYRCSCAANALADHGPRASAAIPDLVHAARQGNDRAAAALGELGEAGIARLVELIGDEDDSVRVNAVNGLRHATSGASVAIPLLAKILREESGNYLDSWRRRGAIDTIRSISLRPSEREAATAAIPDLLYLMCKGAHSDDDSATFTLGVFDADLMPHFEEIAELAATHADYWVRARATKLLAKLARHTTNVLAPLRQALRDACVPTKKDEYSRRNACVRIRRHAVEALATLGDAAAPAVAEVIPLLNDLEEDIRREAAVALGQMRSPAAVPGLRSALRDSAEGVRARAAESLGQLGDPAAAADLIRVLRSDESARVRRETAVALGRLRSQDEAILAALREAENDADKSVRARASAAVKRITRR